MRHDQQHDDSYPALPARHGRLARVCPGRVFSRHWGVSNRLLWPVGLLCPVRADRGGPWPVLWRDRLHHCRGDGAVGGPGGDLVRALVDQVAASSMREIRNEREKEKRERIFWHKDKDKKKNENCFGLNRSIGCFRLDRYFFNSHITR